MFYSFFPNNEAVSIFSPLAVLCDMSWSQSYPGVFSETPYLRGRVILKRYRSKVKLAWCQYHLATTCNYHSAFYAFLHLWYCLRCHVTRIEARVLQKIKACSMHWCIKSKTWSLGTYRENDAFKLHPTLSKVMDLLLCKDTRYICGGNWHENRALWRTMCRSLGNFPSFTGKLGIMLTVRVLIK